MKYEDLKIPKEEFVGLIEKAILLAQWCDKFGYDLAYIDDEILVLKKISPT